MPDQINFYQDFENVGSRFMKISRFSVYKNIPKDVSSNTDIDYLTIIADTFNQIGENCIIGIKWTQNEDGSYDVRSKMLIRYGDYELMNILLMAITKTLVQEKISLQSNRYRIKIEKRA